MGHPRQLDLNIPKMSLMCNYAREALKAQSLVGIQQIDSLLLGPWWMWIERVSLWKELEVRFRSCFSLPLITKGDTYWASWFLALNNTEAAKGHLQADWSSDKVQKKKKKKKRTRTRKANTMHSMNSEPSIEVSPGALFEDVICPLNTHWKASSPQVQGGGKGWGLSSLTSPVCSWE